MEPRKIPVIAPRVRERFARCPCSGRHLPKLVQPSILALLAKEPLHGYAVTERLAVGRDPASAPRHPGVYRILRRMASEGLVRAADAPSASGPQRRVYAITAKGRACLERWTVALAEYSTAVGEFLRLRG